MTTTTTTAPPIAAPAGTPLNPQPAPFRGSGVARKYMNIIWTTIALVIISIGFLLPFLWMLSTSLKTLDSTMVVPPTLIPDPVQVENYGKVLAHPKFNFFLYARNTLTVAVLVVIGTTFSSALVAYGFAKIRFRGRGPLFILMLATMMIPFPVLMVSLFSLFRWMGDFTGIQFMGTFRPLWVPAFFGSAFNIFLLRQFFLTIPDELSEAARIDGCSELGIFFRIILPLASPALSVVALFAFMAAWNDFLGPLIYIQRPEQYTLSLGLQAFQSQHGGTEWHYLMAASLLVILPVVVLFFLVQKSFIQGIATTGMKG